MISFDQFQECDLRIAEIEKAERIEGADKLLRLEVALADEKRQIVAGIAQHYDPEELPGKRIVIVANLEPATIFGVQSQGMLLAAEDGEGMSIVSPERDIAAGSRVK